MKREMTKLGFEKLLAVLAVALVCVCMWGCGDDVTFKWSDGRGSAEIAGFIDDSLVIVSSYLSNSIMNFALYCGVAIIRHAEWRIAAKHPVKVLRKISGAIAPLF